MRNAHAWLALLAWALWLGGLVTLFITVSSLFATFADRHDLAGAAASAIFARFNLYQFALGLIAVFAGLLAPRRRHLAKEIYTTLFTSAYLIACVVGFYLAPHLERMRQQGITHTPAFTRMHGQSMLLYLVEVLLLVPVGPLIFADHDER